MDENLKRILMTSEKFTGYPQIVVKKNDETKSLAREGLQIKLDHSNDYLRAYNITKVKGKWVYLLVFRNKDEALKYKLKRSFDDVSMFYCQDGNILEVFQQVSDTSVRLFTLEDYEGEKWS